MLCVHPRVLIIPARVQQVGVFFIICVSFDGTDDVQCTECIAAAGPDVSVLLLLEFDCFLVFDESQPAIQEDDPPAPSNPKNICAIAIKNQEHANRDNGYANSC